MPTSKRIVILDNHELFAHLREILVEIAGHLGFAVSLCEAPSIAQKLLDNNDCAILIADQELLFRLNLKELPQSHEIPTVMIVDFDDPHSRQIAQDAGCTQILARHYGRDEVHFVLNNIANRTEHSRREHTRVVGGMMGAIADTNQRLEGTIINISEGGAFLKCFHSLKQGDQVTLELEIPKGTTQVRISCRCRVVYVKPFYMDQSLVMPGMGMKFLELEEHPEKELILKYIRDRLMKQP